MNKMQWKQNVARFLPAVVLAHYERRQQRIYLISYPKCGRTWLRLMIGKGLSQEFNLPQINPLQLSEFQSWSYAIPRIRVTHDDNPHQKKPEDIERDKSKYARHKVILLVRDPRDVIVSWYFHETHRAKEFDGSISEFIREERGGFQSLITFYNIWGTHKDKPEAFLLVKYEDMHIRPIEELKRVFNFMGVAVSEKNLQFAVEYSRFENMRELEKTQALADSGVAMRTQDLANESSFKTRKGQTGEYRSVLSQQDIDYLDEMIKNRLSSFYDF